MEVSKRNSIKLRQTVGGKTRQQNAVKIWGHSAQKLGAKTVYIWSFFRRLRNLMANILGKKQAIENRGMTWETTKGFRPFPKFHQLWSTNGQ